ncbi:MAG: flagellar hook-associated protein 1 FlgK [Motiliproteus sp.]|jgi:flagellar hook-associated protein 1 FlgK
MAGSISIALQGLNVAMRGFETSSSNISNVNTPGYSRQQVEIASRSSPEQGVEIRSVSRIADTFATQQLWSSASSYSSTEMYSFFASQTDDLLADTTTNISAVTDQFFAALQTGVDDPASTPNRELILAQSEALAQRFVEVDRQLRAQNEAINASLEGTVNETNQMAVQVAELNDKIRLAEVRNEPANELKDHRDTLIQSIGTKIGISVQTATGSEDINLYVGNGQPLVIGGTASTLTSKQGDPDINDVTIFVEVSGKQTSVSEQISGGEIGGMLDYRNEVLIPSWNELGRLAIVFADTVNQQQSQGVDLDGNMASNWFKDPINSGDVRAYASNTVPMSTNSAVAIRDSSQLQASDYEIRFAKTSADGISANFALTRTSDGKVFTQDDFKSRTATLDSTYEDGTLEQTTAGELKLNLDGLDITLKSTNGQNFALNDKILIKPVRSGAGGIEVALSSGRQLAFASPVRTETAIDNNGTLSVALTTVNNLAPRTGQQISMDLSDATDAAGDAAVPATAVIYFSSETAYSVYEGPVADFDPATATLYDFNQGVGTLQNLEAQTYDPDAGIDTVVGNTSAATGLHDADGDAYRFQIHSSDVRATLANAVTPSRADVESLNSYSLQLVFGKDADQQTTFEVYQVDNDDPTNPQLFLAAQPYSVDDAIQLNGFEITLVGDPEPGDKLDLSFNSEAVSDNRNALQLSSLQQLKLIEDNASYQDSFAQLVERVGTKAQVATINLQANEAIMQSAQSVRDSISGVNLDEEAANLIKFQQQYQAASQVINTARSMFDTLLSSVG